MDEYWKVVDETVTNVFAGEVGAVAVVRRQLQDEPKGTKEKFYQTEPFSVAADIAGVPGEGTPEQWGRYLEIKKRHQLGDVEIPDDLVGP